MKDEIAFLLKEILAEIGVSNFEPEVTIPENPEHGDYSTNLALRLASNSKFKIQNSKFKSPMEIALWVIDKVKNQKSKIKSEEHNQNITPKDQKISRETAVKDVLQAIDRVEVATPGFINFFISEAKLSSRVDQLIKEGEAIGTGKGGPASPRAYGVTIIPRRIMVEFAHPNTHKAFHIGHLRNITTGESIVRLLEATGHEVIRVNYQGDVGMHIAKALYALLQIQIFKSQIPNIRKEDARKKIEFLGQAYAAGSKVYEEDQAAKKETGPVRAGVKEINKKIYGKDAGIYKLYEETRKWSLDYFEEIYKRVGSHFDRYYFESEVYQSGKEIVLEGLEKGVFEESEGAVIFPGKKQGLHNRVFVTSEGHPTYEGKDMGLAPLQFSEYHPDLIIHVVGPEQASYFQVVFEALGQMFPEMKGRQYHLIYGWVKLKQGKMSSRTGNVVLGEWLLDEARKEIYNILQKSASKYTEEDKNDIAEKAAVAAVKYAFLKVGTISEIAFDLKESVNFQGDSGPYLQYTYARCRSVLRKAGHLSNLSSLSDLRMNEEERAVARLLLYFSEIVSQAVANYAPNSLCTYLFQLAQAYNLLYAKHAILGNSFRLALTAAVAQVLKKGLYLLGIETLEQM